VSGTGGQWSCGHVHCIGAPSGPSWWERQEGWVGMCQWLIRHGNPNVWWTSICATAQCCSRTRSLQVCFIIGFRGAVHVMFLHLGRRRTEGGTFHAVVAAAAAVGATAMQGALNCSAVGSYGACCIAGPLTWVLVVRGQNGTLVIPIFAACHTRPGDC
jgi:hypothetical protein